MKWYLVIVCTRDWYTILDKVYTVQAESSGDAESKVESMIKSYQHIECTYGPFDEEPKEA